MSRHRRSTQSARRQPPGTAYPAQPAGLRTRGHRPRSADSGSNPSCSTPSLPRMYPVLRDGGRSRSPLRDSPGFPPGSLSPGGSVSYDSRPAGSTPHTDTTVHDEPAAFIRLCPARNTRSGRAAPPGTAERDESADLVQWRARRGPGNNAAKPGLPRSHGDTPFAAQAVADRGRHRRYRRRGSLRTRSTGHERPAGAGGHVTVVGTVSTMAGRDAADVGIALGTGTDASLEAADIVPAGQCPAPSSHRHRLGQLRPPFGEICARVFGYHIVVIPFAAPCARSIGSGREWKPRR